MYLRPILQASSPSCCLFPVSVLFFPLCIFQALFGFWKGTTWFSSRKRHGRPVANCKSGLVFSTLCSALFCTLSKCWVQWLLWKCSLIWICGWQWLAAPGKTVVRTCVQGYLEHSNTTFNTVYWIFGHLWLLIVFNVVKLVANSSFLWLTCPSFLCLCLGSVLHLSVAMPYTRWKTQSWFLFLTKVSAKVIPMSSGRYWDIGLRTSFVTLGKFLFIWKICLEIHEPVASMTSCTCTWCYMYWAFPTYFGIGLSLESCLLPQVVDVVDTTHDSVWLAAFILK